MDLASIQTAMLQIKLLEPVTESQLKNVQRVTLKQAAKSSASLCWEISVLL
ncbi:hypothetical protein [Enterococcus faecalis]|uniref:hypothetical protein n=1 Tax=Enterococcus faecalis TaxID=1351 RepID=UPI000AF68B4C|nr:hypothetical protein [Enterococcus faecalis]